MFDYWQVQSEKLLFPEIEWGKPEQKTQAGKILIVGGGAGNFRSLALAYDTAHKTGAGQVRVLAPESLRKTLKVEKNTDVTFAPSNTSGGFSSEALSDLKAGEAWADLILFIGDTNKNSETAILFEKFLLETTKPTVLTRDAIDILLNSFGELLLNQNLTIIASFAQLQKIFQAVFYPKVLTFSMRLPQLVENLHKFTLTFPSQIITFHAESLIAAKTGTVFSIPANSPVTKGRVSPIRIWNGEIPTKIAVWQMWNSQKTAEAAITGVVSAWFFQP